CNSYAVF
nr:immunoglobulin light chain junction region [Macaca mulatta]MPN66048.1 immunoglobulin light chain junction region [Macaca mulatta]MPN66991.1 immunoglobulin light chain junction region [Macaca mulatta]MPN67395.1 immunoglobulin light chain junction region [Macaca mulatta]MPN67625.1 immunoglobulin light chain junction region [Macaca mulatta]